MYTEMTVTVSQATLRNAITDIPGLIEGFVTALVTPKATRNGKDGQPTVSNASNHRQQGDPRKTSIRRTQKAPLHKVEDATSSQRHTTKITEVMLDNEDSSAVVGTITRSEDGNTMKVASKRKIRRQLFVEGTYSTGTRSTSSSD